ncbi:ethanolamine utilization protein EutJ [Sporolactobacillus shoreicorticis]|uniref:Ethanolamine utilization protein EutJ n=1 Tax=Sporolactobacillus shoreicorticis TaxID=1923877 RepID=A0ABW5S4X8_9BACL|nr:ethanolamine utilization protein EutJ [Sporolactobacillus shoreicorticis]MCO7124440.1 ethanolamine utilization protein EutJ [Sporolactobacillus shoreicorticis]
MDTIDKANERLIQAKTIANTDHPVALSKGTRIRAGVDLGTSSIVLSVVNEQGDPVFTGYQEANVVRDGLVVNYIEAVNITRRLRMQAEARLGVPIRNASGAIPPGTIGNNRNVVGHVIEAADMELVSILDEPTAAARVLGVQNGAVVDIGGGTTGISIFKEGKVAFSGDEPTGGTQMTLVLSGYLNVSIAEGERIKRDKTKQKENFQIIRPVVEKMASITSRFIDEYGAAVDTVYLVGGATDFSEFAGTFSKLLGREVVQPACPRFVTPLGIAMSVNDE